MSHPVIPAPARFDGAGGRFALRPGTAIGYAAPAVAALVQRFCSEVARRTGLRLVPLAGDAGPGAPAVRVELVAGDELGMLPAPLGISAAGGGPPDERHSLTVDAGEVVLRAVEPVGVARGLTTLVQLLAAAPGSRAGEAWLPAGRILDAPRYAWRGLSIDLARAFFTLDEVRRVIDLLALYKLNVLHVHLTDDESWRLPVGWPGQGAPPGAACYRAEDLRALAAYAADRFVTVVPEVDTPGHTSALVAMRPELNTGRNTAGFELPPGHLHQAVWLDPELPATFTVMEDVLAGMADIFPGPYLHIGGDEPRGMPHDLYAAYVRRVRDLVRAIGRRPLGWQESARAGLAPDDIIQYWLTENARPASLPPEIRAQVDEELAMSRGDVQAAVAASVPVIVSPLSHGYLDVPYAEPSADPGQADRQGRTGARDYSPMTIEESFGWDPAEVLGPGRAAQVAGVEAAIWAETITGFEDLSFLLLPRLPGVAHKAWSGPQAATWADHRDRLARHGRLWTQDELTYFRASTVDWR
jgi:hexosaminidase